MNLYSKFESISTKSDFLEFLKLLVLDLENNKEEWENNNLHSFLSGLVGYCFDKELKNMNWKSLAEILLAARVYE